MKSITHNQYKLLEGFYSSLWVHSHCNTDQAFDGGAWAKMLDDEAIAWSLQNAISSLAQTRDSMSLYLTTHLKQLGYEVVP